MIISQLFESLLLLYQISSPEAHPKTNRDTYPSLNFFLHLFTPMCVLRITHFFLTYLPTFSLTLSCFSHNLWYNPSGMGTIARHCSINVFNGPQWSALLRGCTMQFVPWRVHLQRGVSVGTYCPSHVKRFESVHTTPRMYGKYFKNATNMMNQLLHIYTLRFTCNSATVPHTLSAKAFLRWITSQGQLI